MSDKLKERETNQEIATKPFVNQENSRMDCRGVGQENWCD